MQTDDVTEDFERRVRNNGVKMKNVPNTHLHPDRQQFSFGDYVAKDVSSWAYSPVVESEEEANQIAKKTAEEMYSVYQQIADGFPEITLNRSEDEMYCADVVIDVPDEAGRRERLAEQVAEAIFYRMQ